MTNQRPSAFAQLVASVGRRHTARFATLHSRRRTLLLTTAIIVVAAIAVWPFAHAHLQAVTVLDRVSGRPLPAALRPFANSPFITTEISLPGTNGTAIRARLYSPIGKPNAPAIVVLHGVHHLGMNEPRLIGFAQAMASCGLRVLTPELPGIADYHISPADIHTIGDSAAWLAHQNPNNALRPVGILGLSFSGGLSLLAAADPAYTPDIKFVLAIGSHDVMSRIATFYRTGSDVRPGGPPEVLSPHEYGALVLEYAHLEDFVPAADIPSLRAVLRAHLYEDEPAEKAARAALTPAQTKEAAQLLDVNSPATRALLAINAQRHAAEMNDISPHGHLATLTTPVFLLHGAADNIIPSAESLWMAEELPHASLQAVLISPVLSHINLDGASATPLDQWRLVHFFALVLHAAETK